MRFFVLASTQSVLFLRAGNISAWTAPRSMTQTSRSVSGGAIDTGNHFSGKDELFPFKVDTSPAAARDPDQRSSAAGGPAKRFEDSWDHYGRAESRGGMLMFRISTAHVLQVLLLYWADLQPSRSAMKSARILDFGR